MYLKSDAKVVIVSWMKEPLIKGQFILRISVPKGNNLHFISIRHSVNIEGQGEGKLTKNYKFSFFVLAAKKLIIVCWMTGRQDT